MYRKRKKAMLKRLRRVRLRMSEYRRGESS
jgi:hypothetical protein